MRQWDKLSFELITIILGYLQDDKKDLVSCQLVCKSWRDPAEWLLYRQIEISVPYVFKKILRITSAYSQPFSRTIKLDIYCDRSFFTSEGRYPIYLEESLPWILEHCSNLETILLNEPDDKHPLFKAISNHQGKKLCLENIPEPRCTYEEEVAEYGEAAWKLRDTLVTLTVTNTSVLPYINFKGNDESTTKLNEFPRLKDIEYHFEEDENTYLRKVFRSIGCQKSINIVRIKLYYHYNYTPSVNINYERKDTYANVDSLYFYNVICGESLVNYIIHTFDSLQDCTIHFNGIEGAGVLTRLPSSELELKSDTCIKFINYLNKMKSFDVKNMYVNKLLDVLDSHLPSIIENCSLKLSYHLGGNRISIKRNDGYLHCLHAEFSHFPNDYGGMLPHQTLLNKVGRSVKHLTINTSSSLSEEFLHEHLNGYAFYSVLGICSILQTLCLEKVNIKSFDTQVRNDSLQKLTFKNCSFDDWTSLTQFSKHLPRLKLFHWQNSMFKCNRQIWKMFMEDTSFENLVIEESEDRYRKIYIRIYIKSLNITQLHFIDDTNEIAKEVDEFDFIDDFEELDHYNLLLVDIKCESLQNLGVRTTDFDVAISIDKRPPLYSYGCDEDIVNELL